MSLLSTFKAAVAAQLADAPGFQTLVGAANATEAAAYIVTYPVDEPPTSLFVFINHDSENAVRYERIAVQTNVPQGAIYVLFYDIITPAKQNDAEAAQKEMDLRFDTLCAILANEANGRDVDGSRYHWDVGQTIGPEFEPLAEHESNDVGRFNRWWAKVPLEWDVVRGTQ